MKLHRIIIKSHRITKFKTISKTTVKCKDNGLIVMKLHRKCFL